MSALSPATVGTANGRVQQARRTGRQSGDASVCGDGIWQRQGQAPSTGHPRDRAACAWRKSAITMVTPVGPGKASLLASLLIEHILDGDRGVRPRKRRRQGSQRLRSRDPPPPRCPWRCCRPRVAVRELPWVDLGR